MSSKKQIQFAKLEKRIGYSQAYLNLNTSGFKIITYILFQLRWENISRNKSKPKYIISNKDEITMPYSIFQKNPFKLSNSSITRGIDSLLAHGFIKIKTQGGRCKGHTTVYSFVDDYKNWKPGQIIHTRKPFFKRGFCKKEDL